MNIKRNLKTGIENQLHLPYSRMFPFSTMISDKKTYRSYDPVDDHGDPYAEHAHAEYGTQQIAGQNPEDPHGSHADDHSIHDVAGRTQHVWK